MAKWLLAFIAIGLIAIAGSAQAASPQVLALVATVQPAQMICTAKACQVELSTFCLQQDRQAPLHGTPYKVAKGGVLELIVTGDDGLTRRVAAENYVTLSSVRGFTAITVNMPGQLLAELSATSVAIAVGKNVSLLPAGPTVPSDFAEDDDTKLATGTYRNVGQRVIETSGSGLQSVRAINALINFVPTADFARVTSRDALWRLAVTEQLADTDSDDMAAGRAAFDDCASSFMSLGGAGLQRCLQIRHDAMLEKITHKYWQILGAGS